MRFHRSVDRSTEPPWRNTMRATPTRTAASRSVARISRKPRVAGAAVSAPPLVSQFLTFRIIGSPGSCEPACSTVIPLVGPTSQPEFGSASQRDVVDFDRNPRKYSARQCKFFRWYMTFLSYTMNDNQQILKINISPPLVIGCQITTFTLRNTLTDPSFTTSISVG